MAATEKTAPDDEQKDGAEDAAAAEPARKGFGKYLTRRNLMIAGPVLALLVIGGGAGAYFMLGAKHEAKTEAEELPPTPPQVAFYDVPELLVNIQSPDSNTPAYLKLGLTLELSSEEQKAGMEALMPRLTDQFQAYLRELRVDDLKGSAGILRVKEELLRRVNVAAAPYHVRDVLLKEMIIQ